MLRAGRILGLSLVAHVAVLLLLSPLERQGSVPAAQPPVRVRIVSSPPKVPATTPPLFVSALPPLRASAVVRPNDRGSAEVRKRGGGDTALSAPAAALASPPRYADLLPGPGWRPGVTAPATGPGSAGDHPSFAVEARNISKLSGFAKDLAERIVIPAAVRKLAPSGKAAARFARTPDGWHVIRAAGDPYYRALLFDALSTLSATSFALAQLDPSDYRVIDVTLTFATVSPLDQTQRPVTTSTHANAVTLAYTSAASAAVWNLAMPIDNKEGDDMVIPNLLGMGMLAADALAADNPLDDHEVKRLRLSPAFLKPIGR